MISTKPWLAQYPAHVPPEFPAPTRSMIDVFEETAARVGGGPAVYHFDRAISFAEIDERASRFATLLANWGIGRGDRVALCLQNDPEFLIAQYGAWKRGAVVVPLSPMFKAGEVDYQLADSGARVHVHLDNVHPGKAERTLALSEFGAALDGVMPDARHRVQVGPGDLAYLVYTSGTTGSPKGAMGLHRHIAYNTETFRTWFQIGERDVIMGIAPLFHITGIVAQMALSAMTGAPLVLYHRFDAGETLRLIEKWKATFAIAAITAYLALLRETRAADLSSFTKCGSGGAPVAPAIVEQFEKRFGVYIHNTYGLTESNSPSHLTPFGARGPVDPNYGALAIGVPVPGCEAKIVDLADPSKTLPPGETGEIALRGPMMFAGYWEKPEATAKSHHDGWFLTGDVAVMDERGWFYLVDRKKDMIIASGFKVWPRDVEDVLYQHPAVREAAVIGVPDDYRGETVKAFIALRDGHSATEAEVIEFCKARMAAYKYPRQVEFVAEIPKTATGKFLRRSLRG